MLAVKGRIFHAVKDVTQKKVPAVVEMSPGLFCF
jgi:hypothetical protein